MTELDSLFRAEGWGFWVGLDEEDLALSYVSSFLVSVPLVLLLELFFANESFLDSSRWGKIFLRWGFVDMVLDLCGRSACERQVSERERWTVQLMIIILYYEEGGSMWPFWSLSQACN